MGRMCRGVEAASSSRVDAHILMTFRFGVTLRCPLLSLPSSLFGYNFKRFECQRSITHACDEIVDLSCSGRS